MSRWCLLLQATLYVRPRAWNFQAFYSVLLPCGIMMDCAGSFPEHHHNNISPPPSRKGAFMTRVLSMFVLLAGASFLPTAIWAADNHEQSAVSGFRAEYLAQLDDVRDKLVSLAEAVPAEKYAWRPAEGVRSAGEVYVHLSVANYFFPTMFGIKAPEGNLREMEKTVTGKSEVLDLMKKSFSSLHDVVVKETDADLDRKAELFGKETTVRGVLMALANHIHEHLGQSIAYARMNKIVPPWSAKAAKSSE
jgi:uncharacterized damage-inducible protein DinB